jgi:hypothetical protein
MFRWGGLGGQVGFCALDLVPEGAEACEMVFAGISSKPGAELSHCA